MLLTNFSPNWKNWNKKTQHTAAILWQAFHSSFQASRRKNKGEKSPPLTSEVRWSNIMMVPGDFIRRERRQNQHGRFNNPVHPLLPPSMPDNKKRTLLKRCKLASSSIIMRVCKKYHPQLTMCYRLEFKQRYKALPYYFICVMYLHSWRMWPSIWTWSTSRFFFNKSEYNLDWNRHYINKGKLNECNLA